VGGIVRGNIFADEKVVILSTGIVLGNVTSPRFIVEEGVIFTGNCRILQERKARAAGESANVPRDQQAEKPGRAEQQSAAAESAASSDRKPVSAST
jgi:cytoskeletal protein CcmA (bactofilin family)